MKLVETIPYYLVQVRFQDNEIQIYDIISKKVVASEPVNQKIVALRKVKSQVYLEMNEKDEFVSEISIFLKLISKKSELPTEAGYILDLHMLSQSHGYYFGYYEIGEFKLTEDAKLVKIRSYPVQNCTKGRVNKSSNVYLGCIENSKNILVKLSWKSNRDPKVLWKKVLPSAVMTMEIIGDYLFVGLKNGSLQLWDIQKDECIKNIKLFSSTFSVSTVKGENITLASRDGYVARISKNGKIQWKNKITYDKIVGIYEDKDYILVINTIGEQFHIKFKSGKIIRHRYKNLELGRNAGLSSSIIKYRERFVITGYGGIWTFRHRNSNKSIHQYMVDPLMRIIHQHPFGFYSGDDNGSVCFWSLGDIKIKVENYKPLLQNSEEYYELLKSKRRPKMKDYEEFMVYRLERTGDHTKLNIALEELQNYLNPEQVLIIIRNDLERIFIWKNVNSHVRKKFIASRVAADLQSDLVVNGHYHRCKIISVDQGDEPTGFLKAFGLDSMDYRETQKMKSSQELEDEKRQAFQESMKYVKEEKRAQASQHSEKGFEPLSSQLGIPGTSYTIQLGLINEKWAIRLLKGKKFIDSYVFKEDDMSSSGFPNQNLIVGWILRTVAVPNINPHEIMKTIHALTKEFFKKYRKRDDDDDPRFPYPYIFKPPKPPDDFAMAPQVQVYGSPKKKDPKDEIYCQYCGRELRKEEQLTHSCQKKPNNS